MSCWTAYILQGDTRSLQYQVKQENCFTDNVGITIEFSAQFRSSKCNCMPQHYFFIINNFMMYYQNICGLTNKTNEIVTSLYSKFRQIVCFMEYRLKCIQIQHISIENYNLGVSFAGYLLIRVRFFWHKSLILIPVILVNGAEMKIQRHVLWNTNFHQQKYVYWQSIDLVIFIYLLPT